MSVYFLHCFVVPLDDNVPNEFSLSDECDADEGLLKLSVSSLSSGSDGSLSVCIAL